MSDSGTAAYENRNFESSAGGSVLKPQAGGFCFAGINLRS
jgi:hypothetical protein